MPPSSNFVYNNRETLEGYTSGLKIKEYLGSGCWGSVFSSDNDRWVIKLTTDHEEDQAAHVVMELRKTDKLSLPGLVEVLSSKMVSALEEDGETIYVIVRERITPIKKLPMDSEIIQDLDDALYAIEEKFAHTKEEIDKAFMVLDKHAPHLMKAINQMLSRGHSLIDLAPQNIGVTLRPRLGIPKGSIVLFDLSF